MGSVVLHIDDFDLTDFLPVAAKFGTERYGFVVTPNVDHLIRYHEEPHFRECYSAASFVLLDSRFARRLLRLVKGMSLRVCTGSDLTAAVFSSLVSSTDRVLLIGTDTAQAQALTRKYRLQDLNHYNPPMGFIKDEAEVERCLEFIESHSPFRFCFLAVGCPQQEMIAHALQKRGRARGLALCVGASINFITGAERRAPRWMQESSIEWLFRLMQNPRRLAYRYLVRGPKVFGQMIRFKFVLRDHRVNITPEGIVPTALPMHDLESPRAPVG